MCACGLFVYKHWAFLLPPVCSSSSETKAGKQGGWWLLSVISNGKAGSPQIGRCFSFSSQVGFLLFLLFYLKN